MPWNWSLFRRPLKKSPLEQEAGAPCSEWDVVMYTRQGCPLCEQAWRRLEQAQQRYHFKLSLVDVDTDAQLARDYGEWVPVVVINGRVRFRGVLNLVLLKRLLEAAQ
jgi:glutaredoxin